MRDIIQNFLLMSIVGSILTIFLLCIKPLTKRLFSPRWQYYIWIIVLILMVLPIKLKLPEKQVNIVPSENIVVQTEQITPIQAQSEPMQLETIEEPSPQHSLSTPNISIKLMKILYFIWLTVAILVLVYQLTKYMLFLRIIKKTSIPDYSIVNIPKRLTVKKTNLLDSPLLVGIIKPVLYLPQTEIGENDLKYILLHELTHYRRCDLLYKWFAMFVLSIHWFNPLVYIVSKQIEEECEVSCDYEVCKKLTDLQKNHYMTMIISLIEKSISQKSIPLINQMASSRKILERRFTMIRTKKSTNRLVSLLSVVIAIIIAFTTVFANGALTEFIEDDYKIDVTNNGEKIELINKPFIENNTVYLPLRELLELENIKSEDITYNNGCVEFFINSPSKIEYRGELYDFWINRVWIGDIYAYIGGHSHGSTQNAELLTSPILKNNITYVPFDLFTKLENQGVFKTLTVNVESKNENSCIYGTKYRNDEINFTIDIPLSWYGKYIVEVDDYYDKVYFRHKDTYEKYGDVGTLFYIERNKTGVNQENEKLLYEDEQYKFIIGLPNDKQDISEYNEMAKDIANIEKIFDVIVKYTPITDNQPFTDDEIASAKAVVEEYYRALNARDKQAILKTLTYFEDTSNVIFWQDEIITVNNITYNPFDDFRKGYIANGRGSVNNTKLENVIVLRVNFTVTNAKHSALSNGDYNNYAMILIRKDKNSEWLIDDMGY